MNFEINETAILISARKDLEEFIGSDVVVLSGLTYRKERAFKSWCINEYAYLVEFTNGTNWWVSPETLRKKKPPEEASWEKIQEITKGWNPSKKEVTL